MSENPLLDIDPIKDVPLSPSIAVSALAMNFALKYCDMITVQDGTLYQQYKLEGKNMRDLCMDEVIHYARQFEARLLAGEERHIHKSQIDAALDAITGDGTGIDKPAWEQRLEARYGG